MIFRFDHSFVMFTKTKPILFLIFNFFFSFHFLFCSSLETKEVKLGDEAKEMEVGNHFDISSLVNYDHGSGIKIPSYEDISESGRRLLLSKCLRLYKNSFDQRKRSVVPFVGGTGEGKSTTINYALRKELIIENNRIKVKNPVGSCPAIGHSDEPKTFGTFLYPHVIKIAVKGKGGEQKEGFNDVQEKETINLCLCDSEGYQGKRISTIADIIVDSFAPYFTLQTNRVRGILFVVGNDALVNTKNNSRVIQNIRYMVDHFGAKSLGGMKESVIFAVTKTRGKDEREKVLSQFVTLVNNFYKRKEKKQKDEFLGMGDIESFFYLFLKETEKDKHKYGIVYNNQVGKKYTVDKNRFFFVEPFKRVNHGDDSDSDSDKEIEFSFNEKNREDFNNKIAGLSPISSDQIRNKTPNILNNLVVDCANSFMKDIGDESELIRFIKEDEDSVQSDDCFIKNCSKRISNYKVEINKIEKNRSLEEVCSSHFVRHNPAEDRDGILLEASKSYNKSIESTNNNNANENLKKSSISIAAVTSSLLLPELGLLAPVFGSILGIGNYAFYKALSRALAVVDAGKVVFKNGSDYVFGGYLGHVFQYSGDEMIDFIECSATNGSFVVLKPSLSDFQKFYSKSGKSDFNFSYRRIGNPDFREIFINYTSSHFKSANATVRFKSEIRNKVSSKKQISELQKKILTQERNRKNRFEGNSNALVQLQDRRDKLKSLSESIQRNYSDELVDFFHFWYEHFLKKGKRLDYDKFIERKSFFKKGKEERKRRCKNEGQQSSNIICSSITSFSPSVSLANEEKEIDSDISDFFLSGSRDGTACLWQRANKVSVHSFDMGGSSVRSVLGLVGGKNFLLGCEDGSISFWNVHNRSKLTTASYDSSVGDINDLKMSPSEKLFLSCHDNNLVLVWDMDKKKVLTNLVGHSDRVYSLSFMSEEKAVSSSCDKSIIFWDLNKCKSFSVLKDHHSGHVRCIDYISPNCMLSGGGDSLVKMYDIRQKKFCRMFKGHQDSVYCLVPDGKKSFFSGGRDKKIKKWHIGNGKPLVTLEGHSEAIRTIDVFSNDFLISGSYDKTIKMWNRKSGKFIKDFLGHSDMVLSLKAI